jgi:hypothetical protein
VAGDWGCGYREDADGGANFAVRNRGSFYRDFALPEGSVGKFALLIGRVSSERINADGAITGLPYLYGYMMDSSGGRIIEYLQGQKMLGETSVANQWVTAWGLFQVPERTRVIRFFLNQAERKDVPQNGSTAKFNDVGLYLFDSKEDVVDFIRSYQDRYGAPAALPIVP